MTVEVVLLKDVPKLGVEGQSVVVKGGYFRNYLLPEGFATYATPELLSKAKEVNQKIAKQKEEAKQSAKQIAVKLQGQKIKLTEKLNKKGKLYKQINLEQILEAIKSEHGIEVPTGNLSLNQKIKEEGTFEIPLNLGHDQIANITLTVEGEQEDS
jgi:large subunit ribosomal protein L9